MSKNTIAAVLDFAALVGCSTATQRIDVEPAKLTGIRSIAVIRPPQRKAYTVINFNHPGMLFGAIGGLIAQEDANDKQKQLNEAFAAQRVDIATDLATVVAERLAREGYQAQVEDGPWELEDGKYRLPYEKIRSDADAVLIMAPTLVGFVAPRLGADFQPTVRVVATLLAKDHKTALYRGYHAAGWVPAVDVGWKETPSRETYPNFDAIIESPAASAAALKNAAATVATNVATDLDIGVRADSPRPQVMPTGSHPAMLAPPPAPAPATTALASVKPKSIGSASLPQPGAHWSYTVRDRGFSGATWDFSVVLNGVSDSTVTETVSSKTGQEPYGFDARVMTFVVRRMKPDPVFELSPYLLAYKPSPELPLSGPASYGTGGRDDWKAGGRDDWNMRVTQVAREPISLPAGKFDAIRIKVVGENPTVPMMFGNRNKPQRFEYTAWYAPKVGRYVQARHRVFDVYGTSFSDQWVQLQSFEVAGSSTH